MKDELIIELVCQANLTWAWNRLGFIGRGPRVSGLWALINVDAGTVNVEMGRLHTCIQLCDTGPFLKVVKDSMAAAARPIDPSPSIE